MGGCVRGAWQREDQSRIHWLRVLLCLLPMLGLTARAEDEPPPDETPDTVLELRPERPSEYPRIKPQPCDQIYSSDYWLLDSTRATLEETLCKMALWLDGVTGEEGNVLAARRSRGRAELSYYHSEFGGSEFRVRMKVRVELPVLKERLSAFVGLDDDEEFIQGRSEGFALRSEFPTLNDDDDWLAGLGYSFPGSQNFRSEFRVGARGITDTEVFIQNRFQYLPYADHNDVLTLREILFWTNEEGFGATTGFDWMHVLHDDLLARWDNVGTVSEERLGLDWRSAALLYVQTGDNRGVAFQAFIRGETRHPVPIREYGLRIIHRLPMLGERLFLELITGYTWPQIDPAAEREGSFGFGAGLEMPFGPRDS